jgi:hypothetical protein
VISKDHASCLSRIGLEWRLLLEFFLYTERYNQSLVKLPYMGFKGNIRMDVVISIVFAIAPLELILHNSGEPGF